jgi:ADP-ribose pyrophosphatase
MKCWETLKRKILFDASPWLKLYSETVRLEDGREIENYYSIEQSDFVEIFALNENNEIIGIRHYKHGAKRINLGLPAGYIEGGESPLSAAQRELLEETGYTAKQWEKLGTFVVDGNRGCGHVHAFYATNLEKNREAMPDDLETIVVEQIHLRELPELLANGEVATLGAAIGIALGLLRANVNNME